MTASTLYEAIEPQLLWKQLLTAIFAEIVASNKQFEASSNYSPSQPEFV
jgi:hypothetical protein